MDDVHEDTAPVEVFWSFGANINKMRKLITQNLRRKNQSQIPIIIAEITPHTPAKNTVKILASADIVSSSNVIIDVPDAVFSLISRLFYWC